MYVPCTSVYHALTLSQVSSSERSLVKIMYQKKLSAYIINHLLLPSSAPFGARRILWNHLGSQ